MTGIPEGLAAVRARVAAACDRAGRDPATVTLIGVTKGQPADAAIAAWEHGLEDFGENFVQEGVEKASVLAGATARAGRHPRLHFIGHLQSNKARLAAATFDSVHALDSPRLLRALDGAAHGAGKVLPVFIQVNLSAEATKHGCAPADLGALIEAARSSRHLGLVGLMTIPPRVDDAERARPWFRLLRQLAADHGLEGLSMGMTNDFEVAIEEGATHIRVGRAIFGERTL